MRSIKFAKLVCGGNDFIIIDGRDRMPGGDLSALARSLCDRRSGVGADGLIILVADDVFPFAMMLFNEDGSSAEVSYNGSRCVGLYASREGLTPENFRFASKAGSVGVTVDGDEISLDIPAPQGFHTGMKVSAQDGEEVVGDLANVGIPYFVIFREDLEAGWVETVPPRLRTNKAFPSGTNVAVARPPEGGICAARFFERGVAEETASSGSGCVAVALTAALRFGANSPITVRTEGGDFEIVFSRRDDNFTDILSAGKVSYVFRGETADSGE